MAEIAAMSSTEMAKSSITQKSQTCRTIA